MANGHFSTRFTYGESLRDPRWQRRRLEILSRDDWTCQRCDETTKPLHVHHLWYVGLPWEAPGEALEMLCEPCHEAEKHHPLTLSRLRLKPSVGLLGKLQARLDQIDVLRQELLGL